MEYNIISQCGASETTTAYKARVKKSLSFVCIKKRPRPGPETLDSRVALHRSLPTHPNILPLLAYYATPRNIYRVYEYAPGGCLRSIITSDKGLPEGALRLFGCDLVRLLHHVHSSGIALGALSPEALFLDEDGTVKLGNVKGAARVPARYDPVVGYPGGYSAPEYLAASGGGEGWLTQGGDLWSLGVCLWELACGTKPAWKEGGGGGSSKGTLLWDTLLLPDPGRLQWGGEHPTGGDIDAPPPPPIPRIPPSTELHFLLLGLLHPTPTSRLTWQGVLSHPFWDGVEDLPKLPPPLFLSGTPRERVPLSLALATAPFPTPSTTLTPSSSLESEDAQATVGQEIKEGSGKGRESIKEEDDSTIPSESSSTNASWVAPQGMELSSALRYSAGLTNLTAAQHHSTFISTSSASTPLHPSRDVYAAAASPLSIGLPIGGGGGGGVEVGVGGIDVTNGTLSTSARERERLELPAAPSASTWSLPLASAVLAFRVTPLAPPLVRAPPQNPEILPFAPPSPPSHPLPSSLFPALVSALSLPGDPLVQLSTLAYLLKDPNSLQSVCNDLLSLPSFLTAMASLLSPHSTTAAVNSRAAQVLSALIQGASELRAEVVLPVLPKALMRCVSETTSASARQSAAGALAELIYYRAVGVVEEEEEEGGEVGVGWEKDTTTATTTVISPWRFHPSLWTFLIKHMDPVSETDGVVRNTFLQCIGNCCIAAPRALLPSSSLPVEEEGWDGDLSSSAGSGGGGGGGGVPVNTWELLASLSGGSQQSSPPLVWEEEEEGAESSIPQPFSNLRFKAVLLLTAALTCHPLSGKEDTVSQLAECAISGLQGSGVTEKNTPLPSPPAVVLALVVASTMKGFNGSSRLMAEGGKWSGVVGRLCNACVSAASSSSSSSSPASSAATTPLSRDSILPLAAACALLGLWGVERGGSSKIPSSHLLSCIPSLLTLLGKHPCLDRGVEVGESGGVLALPSLSSSLSRTFVLAAAALPSIPPSLPPCIDALLGLEGALRGEALGKALVNSTLGTPTQSPLLGRAVLKALAQGLECDFDPPPSLLALAARALALYGAVVRLHKDDTGFGGSSGGGGDVSILLPPHTFGSVDDTGGTWGVHQGGSATAIAALLAACIPPLKRHFIGVSQGVKGGENWGVRVANSAWPYLNLAFTLLALPHPPLDAFASPQHFASTLCSDMLLPTLALHAALGLDGKGGSVRPLASSSTPPPPSSFLLLRSALVELTTQVLRRCKALGVITHVLATTPHLPHALLATAAREASWWGDGSASLLGGMEVLSASLDSTAQTSPPLSWRSAAYDYGVGTLMLAAVAAGVQSAGRGEGGNELVLALTLIERFLEGSVLPDVLSEGVEGEGEGGGGGAYSVDIPLPSKRISLDKLLTSLLHLPPLLTLLLNWSLSSPLEVREQLAGLGALCGNILGSLALAHPVDTGFSLLDWSQQAKALCEALTPGFLPANILQQALSHPSLSLLVTTVAEYECSEHVITALCCVVEACDDAKAVAMESMDWGAAAAATGLSSSM